MTVRRSVSTPYNTAFNQKLEPLLEKDRLIQRTVGYSSSEDEEEEMKEKVVSVRQSEVDDELAEPEFRGNLQVVQCVAFFFLSFSKKGILPHSLLWPWFSCFRLSTILSFCTTWFLLHSFPHTTL